MRKDGVAGKELSNEGKAHQREMERLDAEASAWIFRGEYAKYFFSFCFGARSPFMRIRYSCKVAIFFGPLQMFP